MSIELTKEEKWVLRNPRKVQRNGDSDTVDPLDGELTGSWRPGDNRGITLEMCNAIRCAVLDGKTYREVGELFSFISSAEAVRCHAQGDCVHGELDMRVVPCVREPGPVEGVISREVCGRLREGFESGEFGTYVEAAGVVGRSVSQVWVHINGECSHGSDE